MSKILVFNNGLNYPVETDPNYLQLLQENGTNISSELAIKLDFTNYNFIPDDSKKLVVQLSSIKEKTPFYNEFVDIDFSELVFYGNQGEGHISIAISSLLDFNSDYAIEGTYHYILSPAPGAPFEEVPGLSTMPFRLEFRTDTELTEKDIKRDKDIKTIDYYNCLHSGVTSNVWENYFNGLLVPEQKKVMYEVIYAHLNEVLPSSVKYFQTKILDEYSNYDTERAIKQINEPYPLISPAGYEDEIDNFGALLNYKQDRIFVEDWKSFSLGDFNYDANGVIIKDSKYESLITEKLKWLISDIKSIAFRRKYASSYLGFKMIFGAYANHGLVGVSGFFNVTNPNLLNYKKTYRFLEDNGEANYLEGIKNDVDAREPFFVEGTKDFSLIRKFYQAYDEGNVYDTTVRYDEEFPVIRTNNLLLEHTISSVLKHKNTLAKWNISPYYFDSYSTASGSEDPFHETPYCLSDLPILSYVKKSADNAKRVLDKIKIGNQLSVVTDDSGYYTQSDSLYTMDSLKLRFTIIKSNFDENKKVNFIKLGTGGKAKQHLFIKKSDIKLQQNIYGDPNTIYNNTIYSSEALNSASYLSDEMALIQIEGANLEKPLFEQWVDKKEVGMIGVSGAVLDVSTIVDCKTFEDETLNSDLNLKMIGNESSDAYSELDALATYTEIKEDLLSTAFLGRDETDKVAKIEKITNTLSLPSTVITDLSETFEIKVYPQITDGSELISFIDYNKRTKIEKIELRYKDLVTFKKEFYIIFSDDTPDEKINFGSTGYNENTFYDDFYIDGDYKNPFEMIVEIGYNSEFNLVIAYSMWSKVITAVGPEYRLIQVEKPFMKIFPGFELVNYSITDNRKLGIARTRIVHNDSGKLSFITLPNGKLDEVISLYGMNYEIQNYDTDDHIMLSDNIIGTSSVLSALDFSYYTNTTKNRFEKDSDNSAVVGITEMGVFNTENKMIAYATFPPVIYNSFYNHLSLNIIIAATSEI